MSTEENKILVHRFNDEYINAGNLAAADELVAVDIVDHTSPPGLTHGRESHKKVVALFHTAFPDVRWTLEDVIAEGDKVAVRLTMRGTHQGEFFGIPPTGKQVTVSGIHIVRIANGRIAEHWGTNDDLGFLRQLGVLPLIEADQ